MARVFIGVPTLNRPDLARETIESLRAQGFGDFRAVVSDNGSSPEATAALQAYVEGLADPRFAFVRQPVNGGEYGQGWYFHDRSQDHELMMILHDDDLLEPDYLAEAVAALDAHPDADLVCANAQLIDRQGRASSEQTAAYLRKQARVGVGDGLYDILSTHMMSGFTPISGTLFRVEALRRSGFVDEDCHGNFPFELNLFLRLGDVGAKGWFLSRELIRVRFHDQSLRSTLHIVDNPHVVRTMLKLLTRRRYTGAVERRRKVLVARMLRADALIRVREGDLAGARRSAGEALHEHPASLKAAGVGVLAWTCPSLLKQALPPLFSADPPPPVRRAAVPEAGA